MRRPPRLIPADPNPDHTRILLSQRSRLAEDPRTLLHPKMPHRVDDPQQRHAKILLATHTPALNRRHHLVHIQPPEAIQNPNRDIRLGMPHALLREVPQHRIRNRLVVGRRMQPLRHRLEAHQEAGEVVVAIDLLRLLRRQRRGVVRSRQFKQRRRRNRAFKMKVQLGFRKPAQPGLRLGLRDMLGSGHLPSLSANRVSANGISANRVSAEPAPSSRPQSSCYRQLLSRRFPLLLPKICSRAIKIFSASR